MKNIITCLILCLSISLFAQRGGKIKERIKTQKIAFITKQLDLSPKEAEKFWPIYNAYEAKMVTLKSKDLRKMRMGQQDDTLSEDDAKKLLDKLIITDREILNAKLQLVTDLKKVLSANKILKLRRTEELFHKKLLERLREMRQKRGEKKS